MKTLILASVLFFTQNFARASDKGNGGHVYVCSKNGQEVIVPADVGIFSGDYKVSLGGPNLGYQDKVRIAIKRAEKFNPLLAKVLADGLSTFKENVEFRTQDDIPLVDWDFQNPGLNDSHSCTMEQFAINYNIGTPGPHYIFSRDIWAKATEEVKAVIVIHEILYRYLKSMSDRFGDYYGSAPISFVGHVRTYVWNLVSDYMIPMGEPNLVLHSATIDVTGVRISAFSSMVVGDAVVVGPFARWEGFPQGICGRSYVLLKGSKYWVSREQTFKIAEKDICMKESHWSFTYPYHPSQMVIDGN